MESFILIRFFQGIASAMIFPVALAYVGDITPKKREGFIMGLLTMGHSLGMLLGPILAGIMMDVFQLGIGFIIGTAVMLLGVTISLVLTANFQTLVQDST